MQVFNDAIEALRVSYKKMNPFCVPFATTNMGSAILAMDLVQHDLSIHSFV
jgi:3-oxoacyl-[acyl-carrier-protein] synthase II